MFMRFSELRVGSFKMLTTHNRPQLPTNKAKTTHKVNPAQRRTRKARTAQENGTHRTPFASRARNLQPNPKFGTLTLERTPHRKT